MTEAKWLTSTDPAMMFRHLSSMGYLNDRKLRLFRVACCRGVWFWLEEEENERALEAHERVADDLPVEIRGIHGKTPVWTAWPGSCVGPDWTGWSFAWSAALESVKGAGLKKGAADCDLIRDILGNPFRELPTIETQWFAWNGGALWNMAQAIYNERAFDRMPILADALEDAGCDDADILRHCRGPGEHVRGCWLIDLLL